MKQAINIIFNGPPGPKPNYFVEAETDDGASICVGEWIKRIDGLWTLRITELPEIESVRIEDPVSTTDIQ